MSQNRFVETLEVTWVIATVITQTIQTPFF